MTHDTIQFMTPQDVRRRAIGILGATGFGGVWAAWAVLGLSARHGGWAAFFGVAALAILVGLVIAAVELYRIARHAGPPQAASRGQRRHTLRRYLLIVAAEIVAMNLVGWALYPHHMDYLVPTIALIGGLHFFPLAALFRSPHLRIAAVAISVAALAGIAALALGLDRPTIDFLLDAACALALWTTGFASWRSIRRQLADRAAPRKEAYAGLPVP